MITYQASASCRMSVAPPLVMNILDQHGGFTAETRHKNTLWRPASVLKKTTEGRLQKFNPQSFYQTNNDVTEAWYRVPGYGYLVVCWFDNKTLERIA